MQFLYPGFLWALLTLAVPVIIHLFHFRRFKRVYFTNVRFLKEIKEETSSRNRLKNLLILLMRCLALAALVFAFAQPFIPTTNDIKAGAKEVSIYIDNSFSMDAEKENIPLLDLAKERAKRLVNAYTEEDKFQIITNDFEGRHQRFVSKDEAIGYIDEIAISPSSQPLSKVLQRQKQIFRSEKPISFLISDFQKSVTDLQNWKDTLVEINLLPIQHSIEKNVSIDSVWFVSPATMLNQTNKLAIRVTNHAKDPIDNVKASIWKDGQEKPIGLLKISAKSSVIDTTSIIVNKPGLHSAEIRINDFPVQYDDKYNFSFVVKEKVNLLSISEGQAEKYLPALVKGIPYFSLDQQNVNQIQYQTFGKYDLIILQDVRSLSSGLANELSSFIDKGGKVLVFPHAQADISSYNQFLKLCGALPLEKWEVAARAVSEINTHDFVFSDVYESVGSNLRLPNTKGNFLLSKTQTVPSVSILRYRDGSGYLNKYIKGNGQLYVCASSFKTEYNDMATNAEVFVPLVYKMALSKNKNNKLAYAIGQENLIELENQAKSGEVVYKIKGKNEFIPSQVSLGNKVILDVKNQVKEAGYYDLLLENTVIDKFAFNYNRAESNLDLSTTAELEKQTERLNVNIVEFSAQEGLKDFVGEKDQGIVLWKWFLIGVLIFLLLESLIIRFVKS
jgi:hypothetical protein